MELTNTSEIRGLMERHGVRFQKKFGQNFLINKSVPERIAKECGAGADDGVLEIGPGIGTLTAELCGIAGKVVALEIDAGLIPILKETLEWADNVRIINADVMKTDIGALIKAEFKPGQRVFVCANLPYYITTPILMKLLESGERFESMTFMVQKEVADRLCASPGTSEYGAVTLSVGYRAEISRLFSVSPGSFLPPPKVSSTVVKLDIYKERKYVPENEKLFFGIIRYAFETRRKTLVNSLSGKLGVDKAALCGILREIGFPEDIRGERLSVGDFTVLSDKLKAILKKRSTDTGG